jgi:hypothetical protein
MRKGTKAFEKIKETALSKKLWRYIFALEPGPRKQVSDSLRKERHSAKRTLSLESSQSSISGQINTIRKLFIQHKTNDTVYGKVFRGTVMFIRLSSQSKEVTFV